MLALLLAAAALLPAPADFPKWWSGFQAAVVRRDAAAVAASGVFPMDWENGAIRKIASAGELKAHFDTYFTAEIRRIVATGTPERMSNGGYLLTWHARGNEYSLLFRPQGDSYVLEALSEGPP